jgi:16S rRNA (cytosine1402-N4)-methyltransferase
VAEHVPVLLREVMELLRPRPGERALDATVGGGGHARAIAERIGRDGVLVGIDRDEEALRRAAAALEGAPPRVCLRRADFAGLERELDACGVRAVDVALFDLGMSGFQVGEAERGFSFRLEGPLDMRMDRGQPLTAADIVNSAGEDELAGIFRRFGEERQAGRIARAVVRERERSPVTTTTHLAALVEQARRGRRGKIHPATRVFQALRIAVNREIESLDAGLPAAFGRLAPGGSMAVVSFHSLEDRVVKGFFRERRDLGEADVLTKRPVRPSAEERAANPRARSARLRALRKAARP